MNDCVFCKIINGDIPSVKVYEDDDMVIVKDIAPQAPVHLLLLPKEHYANIVEMSDEQAQTLARCIKKLSAMVDELGLSDGFRLVSNKGKNACQSVEHLHIHILGGAQLADRMA
ncbi:MAG: histidine triad nucleotide-binding protein [Christensenellales bacterium]|nr:histidine triad nucleotide-binding protein [Christensenellales bacterium]